MKLKDLIPKLQALNPEAEVYVYGGVEYEGCGPQPLESVRRGNKTSYGVSTGWSDDDSNSATPSDTLIVLSE